MARGAVTVEDEELALERVLEDLLAAREEDLALDERVRGEREEDEPDGAHEHGHGEVPDVEALQLEDVAEHANRRDPAH